MLYMFHAIWEFVQSWDCVAHSQNPEIAHYSCVTLRLCKLWNLHMHTILDIQSPPTHTHINSEWKYYKQPFHEGGAGGQLLNSGMKDDTIMVKGDDLRVSTWTIYFARWPVNGISRGHQGIVSTVLCHFIQSSFQRARCKLHDMQAYT